MDNSPGWSEAEPGKGRQSKPKPCRGARVTSPICFLLTRRSSESKKPEQDFCNNIADNFFTLLHNHSSSRRGASPERCISTTNSRPRQKPPVTPDPGRLCSELLCYDDFTAIYRLQAHENKDFTPKVWVGVPHLQPPEPNPAEATNLPRAIAEPEYLYPEAIPSRGSHQGHVYSGFALDDCHALIAIPSTAP